MAVNGFESASKAKIWKFSPKRLGWAVIIFAIAENTAQVFQDCKCIIVCLFLALKYFFLNCKTSDTLKDSFHSLVKNTSISTYSLSHKSSILWLCIYDTWPLFLPCGCTLRDNRGPVKHIASLLGNISYVSLYNYQHIKVTELQSGRGV